MFLWLLLLQIVLFSLVFYKLVTTNHWTIGKKLLVALVGAIILETMSFILISSFALAATYIAYTALPKALVGTVMVYFIWKDEIHH